MFPSDLDTQPFSTIFITVRIKCFTHHIVLDRKAVTFIWKMQENFVWQWWALLPCFFFRWKIDWNWPFSCKIFQIWHISIFQPQHASKKNLPNLDSPCELVFPACSFPALRSLRMDPILGFHMPRIPLSWTQAAISQKNHFQVSNLVESATCPSSLCKNPELICCRTIRNSSSFLSTSTGFDQNQL